MRTEDTTVGAMLVSLRGAGIDVAAAYAAADCAGLRGLSVLWNARLRTAAGRCVIRWPEGRALKIELSPKLIAEGTAALAETLLHELAHALAPNRKSPHGYAWSVTARTIGSNGQRCHALASFRPNAKRVVALCSGCDYQMRVARLTTERRSWIASGSWRHRCGGTFYPASDTIRGAK